MVPATQANVAASTKIPQARTVNPRNDFGDPEALSIFLEYLRLIGKWPRLFKVQKVDDIYFLLQGFHMAEQSLGRFLNGFDSYVESTLDMPLTEQITWSHAIRANSTDDEQALRLFFRLMEEFLVKNELI